ncbi:MAG: 23S rRNA (pseudouridine(1915)-N(3))-methyltransferase RlmH [bacterium]|nr:23S rRNA (pseudouridine(1915)-N(3))-methyltransferase RlmH [bacterium]
MHHFIFRVIGSAQESWHREAIASYTERLKPFAKVEMIELEEGHGGSAKPDEEKTRKKEAEALLKSLPSDAAIVALDETGKNLGSREIANWINDRSTSGSPIVFLIGGSWGLDKAVRERADLILSFGKQTLPHLLARIVLLEQLYRAETIIKGKTYHK